MTNKDALDLDRVFGKARNFIYRVGVELEGGWTKLPPGCAGLQHDGSVVIGPTTTPFGEAELRRQQRNIQAQVDRGDITIRQQRTLLENLLRGRQTDLQQGELPSEILEPEKVADWIKTFHPTHVNNTCGLHVHMSFKQAIYYQRLMTPKYPATILKYVTIWAKKEGIKEDHCLWARVRGESEYCQHKFYADQQAIAAKDHDRRRVGNRYTMINYCHHAHGTIECRLLPMFEDKEVSVRAVQNILDTTNAFLHVYREKEIRANHQVIVRSGDDRVTEARQEFV